MARLRSGSPKPASVAPLNSLDWIGRFVLRLMNCRPGITVRLAASLAIEACPEFREVLPEDAAMIVAKRDL